MHRSHRRPITLTAFGLMALSLAAAPPPAAHAQLFTNRAAFAAALGTNAATAYTETFTGGATVSTSQSFASGGYAYTVTAPGPGNNRVARAGGILGSASPDDSLVFTFTSANVSALGGNFFAVDSSGSVTPATLTLALDNGTSITFQSSSANAFRGYIAPHPILSLTYAPPADTTVNGFAALDNFSVATAPAAAPEPSPSAGLSLGALGLGGLTLIAKKRGLRFREGRRR